MSTAQERLEAYRRTVIIIAVVVFLYLAFMIVRPFLIALIGSAVLAYLFYPIYKFLLKYMPKFLPGETIAALITCLLIVLIVLIPMGSITGLLTAEIASGYRYLARVVSSPSFTIEVPPVLARYVGDLSQYNQQIAGFGMQIIAWLQNVVKGIPNVFLNLLVTIISVYFFLKGGKNLYGFFQEFFPLSESRYKQILERLDDLSRGMLMGQIVVGVIHGLLAWFAYSMLGVGNPVLWAFLTALISIIPVLGAGLVWGPIALYLLLAGLHNGTYWKGIVLFTYGLLLMSTIDNVLKPKIIGQRSRIHPLIILFGILGGIQFLGLPGIIIGPLVLGLFDVVLSIFREVI
ncbi:MAG: AI-2E family transporter [Candidatus Saganbacteria bacterium]|nr:AI-2E family transporter [Candidatus Saganbacteria bacterium]